MSRLLFAAARGARIEDKPIGARDWGLADFYWFRGTRNDEFCRIHTDDAHLQYGPISSALRNFAMYGESRTFEDHMAAAALKQEYCGCSFVPADPVVLGTIALFLAEALADEGL